MLDFFKHSLAFFLPIAAAATAVLIVVYADDQQLLRQGANEPQEWLAQDAAARLGSGETPEAVAGTGKIAIETAESPYLIITDATGKPIAGTGYLNGTLAQLPVGIFTGIDKVPQHWQGGVGRLTWQPEPNVREAVVIVPVGDHFVVSGRSLAYTEREVEMLGLCTLLGWMGTMAIVAFFSLIAALFMRLKISL